MEMEDDSGGSAENSQNINYTDDVEESLVSANERVDRLQDLASKDEAFPLPPMAAVDLEMNLKTLVLDIDDTLIHTSSHPKKRFDFTFELSVEGKARKFFVLKRPGVENLLQELSKLYEIVIFTAADEKYANAVLEKLDPQGKIKHRLTRKNCTKLRSRIFVKDLSKLGRDLKKLIFVDDKPFQCFQSENAYPISPFNDDVSDRELFCLVDLCKRVAASTSDVRDELRKVASAMSASRRGQLSDVQTREKKTLVLGLEGVLVHSTYDRPAYYDFTVDVYGLFWKKIRYVLKRPGVDTLVAELAELFEIVVFSSEGDDYVNDVLDKLDPNQTVFCEFMMSCRDLSKLGRDLSKVIFVDVAQMDSCTSNVYPVSGFEGDMRDKTLFELIRFCKRVAHATSDVRKDILFYSPQLPPLSKSTVWVEYTSRSVGKKYYYNMVTGRATWRKPPAWISEEESLARAVYISFMNGLVYDSSAPFRHWLKHHAAILGEDIVSQVYNIFHGIKVIFKHAAIDPHGYGSYFPTPMDIEFLVDSSNGK
ncbi:hypothetical protein SUGI_0068140 [Cryptomeria japonica]|nr:hypothetical protein SUGI_0068140 [Cryptomeria japonica]